MILLLSLFFSCGLVAQSSTETPSSETAAVAEEAPIRRTLYFKFKPEVTVQEIEEVRTTFKGLKDQIDGMTEAIWMVAPDQEETYTHFLMLEFSHKEALKAYEEHPDHKAIAAKGPALIAGFYLQDYKVK